MDLTRQAMFAAGSQVNHFEHAHAYPDASFTDVVRPNADTLYSTLWFDVSREPLIVSVPNPGKRYYLFQVMDMWTDAFATPGLRTHGPGPMSFALASPDWAHKLPPGVDIIRTPTPTGFIIGRTQTNGIDDYEAVHIFQDGMQASTLSSWGRPFRVISRRPEIEPPLLPPVERIAGMTGQEFFSRFVELFKANPPHANDYSVLARMKRLGLERGRYFDVSLLPPGIRRGFESARRTVHAELRSAMSHLGEQVNGWQMTGSPIGTYGTDYLRRATIAYGGLGANCREDAMYPTANADIDGRPLDSAASYVLHMAGDELPPVRAFWSLTLYNDKQLFADNPIDRYAIGDRDDLLFNEDGSLDLYLQRKALGGERDRNWLPTPRSGGFNLNFRLYWPKTAALQGSWAPPAVRRLE
jgi:hypothetical protein